MIKPPPVMRTRLREEAVDIEDGQNNACNNATVGVTNTLNICFNNKINNVIIGLILIVPDK